MAYSKTDVEAELAVIRTTIKNIVASQVDTYGVSGGKTFSHLKLKELEARENTLMQRLAAIENGGQPMKTIVSLRTRRGM